MFDINICSPIWDVVPDRSINVRVMRILMSVELLLLYLIYNIIAFVLAKVIRFDQKESADNPNVGSLQKKYKKWQSETLLMLGDHAVAIGFVMCYSPYEVQLAMALAYLVLKIVYEIRLHHWSHEIKLIKTAARIINMTLLLCAMIGISRTGYDQSGICRDLSYQIT